MDDGRAIRFNRNWPRIALDIRRRLIFTLKWASDGDLDDEQLMLLLEL